MNRRKSPRTKRVPLDLFSRAVPGDDVLAVPSSGVREQRSGSSAYGGGTAQGCHVRSYVVIAAAGAGHAGGFFCVHRGKPYNQGMMRYVPLWAALPVLLCAADSRIDHVTISGSELKAMQAKLAAVGIASVYGGAHSIHATEMALVSFPDGSYLELMGIPPNAEVAAVSRHAWAKFLTENAGPCAWAMREKNLAAEVSRLKAAGVAVSAPVGSGRTRPDGVRLEWETSDVGGETRGAFFPFLIQDVTKREARAWPQGKPVTREFRGVTRVVIAVRNLDDALKRYWLAYGVPRPITHVGPC